MKQDLEIQNNVMDALKSLKSFNAAEIGVAVKNGIVTLTGIVDSYPKKIAAERAAWKVAKVRGIAIDIEVRLNSHDKKTDSEIAQAVMHALHWSSGLDQDKIKILVDNGTVTLEGSVDWDYQRKLAVKSVGNITGVHEIVNNLRISEKPVSSELKNIVLKALRENANIREENVQIEVAGAAVKIIGKVNTWIERKEVENTVWTIPGVRVVENHLEVEN